MKLNGAVSVLVYSVLAWACYIATVLLHEWTHGLVAWCFGFKSNPFAIHYGGFGWKNVLYLARVDEAVPYLAIGQAGHSAVAALISIAPPLFVNAGLMVCLFWYLQCHEFKRLLCCYATFCLWLWNLGECFSYFVQRCFSGHGDVSGFLYFTGCSAWFVFVPSVYIVFFFIHCCLSQVLPRVQVACGVTDSKVKLMQFVIVLLVLFVFYSLRGLDGRNNEVTHVLSALPIILLPVLYRFYRQYYRDFS